MTATTLAAPRPARASPLARLATDPRSFEATVAWGVLGPVLALWPFLSALPLFGLLAPVSLGAALVDLALLATGFWPLFALFLAARLARAGGPQHAPRHDHTRALKVGVYALAWTMAAMTAAMVG